jgi:hypothetical protein
MHFSSMNVLAQWAQILAIGIFADAGTPGQPRNYAAPRAASPIKIDGDIYKNDWANIAWSDDFAEIRGEDAPESARPTSKTRTRMKMAWDDDYLYIAAEMSADDWPITAEFNKRNDPIFQQDSDFEVFLDTDGSNHNYKELELNAKNTVWNLMLDKPYSAGGAEHSGRIAKPGDDMHWDVKGQKTAAKMFGIFRQPTPNQKWTAEVALKHTDSLDRTNGATPKVGKFWRINFSRVERRGSVNWVWSPQMVWTPGVGKYQGQINMHAPDAWGYVVFTETGGVNGTQADWVDPGWNLKAAAHQLFYAEKVAKEHAGGVVSTTVLKQKNWINASLFESFDADVEEVGDKWKAQIRDSNGCYATIQEDNLFSYQCSWASAAMFLLSPVHVFVVIMLAGTVGTCFAFRKTKGGGERID